MLKSFSLHRTATAGRAQIVSQLVGVLSLIGFAAVCLIALGHETRNGVLADGLGGRLDRGQSTDAAHDSLIACDRELNGQWYPHYRSGFLAQRRDQCRRLAEVILKHRPTQGYAWYMVALSLSFEGREQEAAAALRRSQAVTPNESWLAARRLRIYLDGFGYESARELDAFWPDAEVGLQHGTSKLWLSLAYVKYPDFRERFEPILKRSSLSSRDAFLEQVRILLGAV